MKKLLTLSFILAAFAVSAQQSGNAKSVKQDTTKAPKKDTTTTAPKRSGAAPSTSKGKSGIAITEEGASSKNKKTATAAPAQGSQGGNSGTTPSGTKKD